MSMEYMDTDANVLKHTYKMYKYMYTVFSLQGRKAAILGILDFFFDKCG